MTPISKFLREKNITLYNWILCKRIAPQRCNWSLRLDVPVNKQLSKSTAWKGHGLMKNAPTYNTTTTVFKIKKGKDMFHSKKKARTWWNLRYLRAWWLCSHESYTTWYWNQKKKEYEGQKISCHHIHLSGCIYLCTQIQNNDDCNKKGILVTFELQVELPCPSAEMYGVTFCGSHGSAIPFPSW